MDPEQVVESIQAAQTDEERLQIELEHLEQTAKPIDPLERDVIGEQNLEANGVTDYDDR